MSNISDTGWYGNGLSQLGPIGGLTGRTAVVAGSGTKMTHNFTIDGLTNIQIHWNLAVNARKCYAQYRYDTTSTVTMRSYWPYATWLDESYLLPNPNIHSASTLYVIFKAGSSSDWAMCHINGFQITAMSEAPTNSPTFYPTTHLPTFDPTDFPTFNPTFNPTINPTQNPTLNPTLNPTMNPTLIPTSEPTIDPQIVDNIHSDRFCDNLDQSKHIEYDINLGECINHCLNRIDCKIFNYFEHFKKMNDSRCYLFDVLCNVIIDTNVNNSIIGYKEVQKECMNYPIDWKDNTGDSCHYYFAYNWCDNENLLKNENNFYNLIDNIYGYTAIDSCCECGGGIIRYDNVAFSFDNDWIYDDIFCEWINTDFTLLLNLNSQITLREYDNLILFNLCTDLLDINCNYLINTNFKPNDYVYSLFLCNYTDFGAQNKMEFMLEIVINEINQTFNTYINSLWFNVDLLYYSSFINTNILNYSQCIANILPNIINETYHYGLHPCYILDTISPTTDPTMIPTQMPTSNPSNDPTVNPTIIPTSNPTDQPTFDPTVNPTIIPTTNPTDQPTFDPTSDPTDKPTMNPTDQPTSNPTSIPTVNPTEHPTYNPTVIPTVEPTIYPTFNPTIEPTQNPSNYSLNVITATNSIQQSKEDYGSFGNLIYFVVAAFGILFVFLVILTIIICCLIAKSRNKKNVKEDIEMVIERKLAVQPDIEGAPYPEDNQTQHDIDNEIDVDEIIALYNLDQELQFEGSEIAYGDAHLINDDNSLGNRLELIQNNTNGVPGKNTLNETKSNAYDQQQYISPEVFKWFEKHVKLKDYNDKYYSLFILNGYDDISLVAEINSNVLIDMGINKMGHRNRILNAVQQLTALH